MTVARGKVMAAAPPPPDLIWIKPRATEELRGELKRIAADGRPPWSLGVRASAMLTGIAGRSAGRPDALRGAEGGEGMEFHDATARSVSSATGMVAGGSATKGSAAFCLFQCMLQPDRQNRFAYESNWIVGPDSIAGRLIEVSAHENAANAIAAMDLARRVNPAAAFRKPDVHKNYIGTMGRRMGDGVTRRRCDRTNLVTKLHHKDFEVHRDESFVLDNQDLHLSWLFRHGDRHHHGITLGTATRCHAGAQLGRKGPHDPRTHAGFRFVIGWSLPGIGNAQ